MFGTLNLPEALREASALKAYAPAVVLLALAALVFVAPLVSAAVISAALAVSAVGWGCVMYSARRATRQKREALRGPAKVIPFPRRVEP
jgi:hypothetical protein